MVSGEMENKNNLAPLLVFDHSVKMQMPIRFRIDAGLKACASGQFSEKNLLAVLPALSGKIWIVDLRQESHGFINGIPISWFGKQNQSNQGLSVEEIQNRELKLLSHLTQNDTATVHEIADKKSGNILSTITKEITIKQVESESQLASRLKMNYFRLPVLDHHRPNDATVESFIHFFKTLPPDAWVYFHCRGGVGRSTTFMVMVDMLLHAKTETIEEIVKRQVALGGSDLFKMITEKDSLWKKDAAMVRQDFIRAFYAYARSPGGYPGVTWHEWLKKQGLLSYE